MTRAVHRSAERGSFSESGAGLPWGPGHARVREDTEAHEEVFNPDRDAIRRSETPVAAIAFCWIYASLVSPKSMRAGVQFGTSWGIAVSWFLGTVVEAIVAGVLVGAIVTGGGRN